jgi:hypothetical protein
MPGHPETQEVDHNATYPLNRGRRRKNKKIRNEPTAPKTALNPLPIKGLQPLSARHHPRADLHATNAHFERKISIVADRLCCPPPQT